MPEIEIPLEVRVDAHGDEFYTVQPRELRNLNLAKAEVRIYHPAADDACATMVVMTDDRAPVDDDAFVKEISRAQAHFDGGYVGYGYFLKLWKVRAKTFPSGVQARKEVLDRLVQEGKIEIYEAPDGKEAIRTVAQAGQS